MMLPKREDALHKIQMYRLLTKILDDKILSQSLYFKGGTCASMLGWLDRFSVDLDFDLAPQVAKQTVKKNLLSLFGSLNLQIKNPKVKSLQFILGYQTKPGLRNQLKLGIVDNQAKTSDYQPFYLPEIDRFALCQTRETMVAHKLVAPLDRYAKYRSIAGRDLYDLHYFFSNGYAYKKEVVEERTKLPISQYLIKLKKFIENKVTEKILSEDLNYLLPYEKFKSIRKTLKTETLMLLSDEIKRQKR